MKASQSYKKKCNTMESAQYYRKPNTMKATKWSTMTNTVKSQSHTKSNTMKAVPVKLIYTSKLSVGDVNPIRVTS